MCIEALKDGKDVVLDATNLKRKLRVAFLNDVKTSFKEAHYFHHEAWSAMYSLCQTTVDKNFRIQRAQLISLHMMKYQSEYQKFIQKWAPEYKDYLDRINEADKECA